MKMAPKRNIGHATSKKKKNQRSAITLAQKIEILDKLKSGQGSRFLGRQYGLNESTIRTIRRNEESIRASVSSVSASNRIRRIAKTNVHLNKVEGLLSLWIEDQFQEGTPLSGSIVREKALRLYRAVCKQDGVSSTNIPFSASAGWFHRFRKRYNLFYCSSSCSFVKNSEAGIQSLQEKDPSEIMQDRVIDHLPHPSTSVTEERTQNISINTGDELLGVEETTDKDLPVAKGDCFLKWTDFQSNLTSVFHDLYNSEQFVDVTLACEDRMFEAHKLVLSACSPYFKNLFIRNPCKHPVVFLKDVKSSHVEALLHFMYHGQLRFQRTELMGLLKTAQSLQVKGLPNMTFPSEKEDGGYESRKDITAMQSSQTKEMRTSESLKRQILSEELHIGICSQRETQETSNQTHVLSSASVSSTGHSHDRTQETHVLGCSQPELLITPIPVLGPENIPHIAALNSCAETDMANGGEAYIQTFAPVYQEVNNYSNHESNSETGGTNRNCDQDHGRSTSQQMSVDDEECQYSDNLWKVKEEVEEMQEFSETWSFAEPEESAQTLSNHPALPEMPDRLSTHTLDASHGSSSNQEVVEKQLMPTTTTQHQTSSPHVCRIFKRKAPDK